MSYEIPIDIVNQATKCPKDLSCLNNGKQIVCPPINNIAGEILFIKTHTRRSVCPYKMSFGYSFICHCPVRKEIYKRYNA